VSRGFRSNTRCRSLYPSVIARKKLSGAGRRRHAGATHTLRSTDGPDEEATALVSRAVEGLDSVDELMGMMTAYRKRDRASRARDQEALESDSFMDSMWFMRQRRRKRMLRATFVCCQSMVTQCEDAAKQLHRAKLLAPALADRLVSELRPGYDCTRLVEDYYD